MTYPNNRVVQYNYNDGPQAAIDEVMSRLGSISNAGNTDTYAVESYLGLDDIVTEDYKDPQVKCDLSSDDYSGLDRFGRVSDMVWWQYGNSGNLTNKLDEFVYWHLDTEGDITGEVEQAQNMSQVQNGFGYDAMGRLTSYSHQIGGGTAATSTWTYDSVGNNIDSTTGGQYDLGNEETTIIGSSVSPAYDAAGNMQTLSTGDGAIYDAWDRLVEVYNPSTSTIVARFSYDGTGRRVEQLTGFTPGDLKATGSATSVTRYYYSGQQLVESDTAVNGVTTTRYQYLWSPRYIDAPILRDTLNTDGSVNTGDRIFYLTDANYNVTAVVGMSGGSWQVVERYRYDAYGKVTVCSPNGNPIGGNASQVGNTILYAGETFDSSTGLYYDRARYYDPQLGRFISQDPMGAAGSGSNLYAYCGDNPTDGVDPTGINWFTNIGARLFLKGHADAAAADWAAGNMTGTASEITDLVNNIIIYGGYNYPLASDLLKNWLDGAPSNPYVLSETWTIYAIFDAHGPAKDAWAHLDAALTAATRPSGSILFSYSTAFNRRRHLLRASRVRCALRRQLLQNAEANNHQGHMVAFGHLPLDGWCEVV